MFTRLSSVQGYGSLIDSIYGNATDTHPLFTIGACQLADGAFSSCASTIVVIGANQLATPVTSATPPTRPGVSTRRPSTKRESLLRPVPRRAFDRARGPTTVTRVESGQ